MLLSMEVPFWKPFIPTKVSKYFETSIYLGRVDFDSNDIGEITQKCLNCFADGGALHNVPYLFELNWGNRSFQVYMLTPNDVDETFGTKPHFEWCTEGIGYMTYISRQ